MGASADNVHGPWAGGPPGWGELSSQDWGEREKQKTWVLFLGCIFRGTGPKKIKQHKRNRSSRLWALRLDRWGVGGLFPEIPRQSSTSASSAWTTAAPHRPEAGTPPGCSVHSPRSQGSTATREHHLASRNSWALQPP